MRCGSNCASKNALAAALLATFTSCAARQATPSSPAATLHWATALFVGGFAAALPTASHDLRNALNAARWSSLAQPGRSANVTRSSLASGCWGTGCLAAGADGFASVDVGGASLFMLGEAAGCGGFSGGAAAAAVTTSMAATAPAVAVHLAAARARAPAMVACDVPFCRQPLARLQHLRRRPRERRNRLGRRLRGDEAPVRIGARLRRRDIAAERPDVRHFLDALRIAVDDGARFVARRRDELADEAHGY